MTPATRRIAKPSALLSALVMAVLVLLTTAPPAFGQQDSGESYPLAINVEKVTPSTTTPDNPGEVTLTGSLINTSSYEVNSVAARIRRDGPISTSEKVNQVLDGDQLSGQTAPNFVPITNSLAPGTSTRFELRIPIQGGPESLQIEQPGVFPLLVEVNGQSDVGVNNTVAEKSLMLPVLNPAPGRAPTPPEPTPVSMLVPLIDQPRLRVQAVRGQQSILTDDELARSLAPGGRLYGIVNAVEESVPPGSPLGSGLCFAVDPDLLHTVNTMKGGYRVQQPGGGLKPGTGKEAAAAWLDKLRGVTDGRCVLPLPFADADLVALTKGGMPNLRDAAMRSADSVDSLLRIRSRRDLSWPIDGALDPATASDLVRAGMTTFLMRPTGLTSPQGSSAQQAKLSLNPQVTAASGQTPLVQPIDPQISRALRAGDSAPTAATTAPAPHNSGAAAVQNALGALTYRASAAPPALGQPSSPLVITPPRRWNVSGQQLRGLLDGMRTLTDARYLRPTGLPQASIPSGPSPQRPPTAEAEVSYPPEIARREVPAAAVQRMRGQDVNLDDLAGAMSPEQAVDVPPSDLIKPLSDGMLRASSSAWRGNPLATTRWLNLVESGLSQLRTGVQVNEFPGQVSLAASDSPTPLTVSNRLPVTMRIRLDINAPPGVKINTPGSLAIPPLGTRQVWLESEVQRAGTFTVDMQAHTEHGGPLGKPTRLRLESTAYGSFTVGLTATAGVLLVILAARRIFRKLRGSRSRPAAVRPNLEGGGEIEAGSDSPTEPIRTKAEDV